MNINRLETFNHKMRFQYLRSATDWWWHGAYMEAKIKRINRTSMPYKMRLAAINASDNNIGKLWS